MDRADPALRAEPADDHLLTYQDKRPRVMVYDLDIGRTRPLVTRPQHDLRAALLARRPLDHLLDGGERQYRHLPRSRSRGGTPQRLTNAPGIDTGGSYSPDGSRIVFESDRGGSQQLYVMNADGSNQRRISFGGGGYATPEWSPRGDLIAFTKTGGFRIGVMTPDGSGERILTGGGMPRGRAGRPTAAPSCSPAAPAPGQLW